MTDPIAQSASGTIHPTAVIDQSAEVGSGVHVGPHCCLGAGVTIGAESRIGSNVVLEDNVKVGSRTTIAAGTFVHEDVLVGDDIVIGPNVAFVSNGFERAETAERRLQTVVRDGASIGANSSVLAGAIIGANSIVGAGTVVTRDVPPFATVVGSPARIVGYVASPQFTTSRRIRASSLRDDDFPLSIGKVTITRLPLIEDLRGSLVVGEYPSQLPFIPQRVFTVFGVSSRETRGEHAHHKLEELLVCVHGECAIAIDDGSERGEIMLDRPDAALHLPPYVWSTQYRYSPDGVLLVLASTGYDPDGYIRDHDEFRNLIRHV